MGMPRQFFALVMMAGLAACAAGGALEAPPAPSQAAVAEYAIGVDDIVQVTVWRNPELGITAPVRPDGRISVPPAADVMAAALTPNQVAADIEQTLTAFARDPQAAAISTTPRTP